MSAGPNVPSEPEPEAFILGAEIAAAQVKETQHRLTERRRSPLEGVRYDVLCGAERLLHFVDSSVDLVVRRIAATFCSQDAETQDQIRSALTMDDFYTLITYARRMTVKALREEDASSAISALTGLAMIDRERIDWRDLSWAAGLVSFALVTLGEDAQDRFAGAAALAEAGTAETLRNFGDSPSTDLEEWGFRVVRTTAGLGLAASEGEPYHPTADLLRLSGEWARRVEDDGVWRVDEPVVGSALPKVWLQKAAGELDAALRSLLGCLSLRGYLAGEPSSVQSTQMLLTFLVEAGGAAAASSIAEAAGPGTNETFVGFGLAHGPVCGVVISRSVVQGIESVETRESIERFRPALQEVLAQT